MGRPFDARHSSLAANILQEQRPTIVVASSSPKRIRWVQDVLRTPNIITVNGGNEADISDVRRIAQGKLSVARRQIAEGRMHLPHDSGPITVVAADVRTSVLTPGSEPDQPTLLISRRKPKHPDETREMFRKMTIAANQSGVLPFFQIYAASAIGGEKLGSRMRVGGATSTVELDPEATRRLTSEHGFKQYEKAVEVFYRHKDFQRETRQSSPVRVTDICSGLALTVLAKMNAVVAIDGVPRRSDDNGAFREALRRGVSTAYVGFDPHLFRDIAPIDDLCKRDEEFTLVNNSVDRALGGK